MILIFADLESQYFEAFWHSVNFCGFDLVRMDLDLDYLVCFCGYILLDYVYRVPAAFERLNFI